MHCRILVTSALLGLLTQPGLSFATSGVRFINDGTPVQTLEHFLYNSVGATAGPIAIAANNAYAGLWYDSLPDGEGFNIVTSSSSRVRPGEIIGTYCTN